MPTRSQSAVVTALLTAALAPASAFGALFMVDASATSGAIGFSGVVDTAADTFTVNTVTDGAGGLDFWTISAPLVLNAVDSGGGAYDVPDTWNGTIDSTWGFLGPQLGTIAYNEGSASTAWSTWSTGWGAFANSAGTIFTTPLQSSALSNWVFTSTNSTGYWITQPGHGALTVTPVPAPSAAGLIAIGGLAVVRRRR